MLLRSTGWLCTAAICQFFVPAAHSQVVTPSPTPTPSPALPSADSESWKVDESNDLGPSGSDQQPMSEPTETPVEQEPGWSGGLLDQPDNQTGQGPLLSNETG
jgi:hypothetical protein